MHGHGDDDYGDLLEKAVAMGLQELDCTIVQIPTVANEYYAVVVARILTTQGGTFSALGEAQRDLLAVDKRQFVLTIAEDRAKVRALGDAVGRPSSWVTTAGSGDSPDKFRPSASISDDQASSDDDSASARARVTDAPVNVPVDVLATIGIGDAVPAAASASEGRGYADANDTSEEVADLVSGDGVKIPMLVHTQSQDAAKTTYSTRPGGSQLDEELGPDVLARLMHLTRKKAESEGTAITEEEAMHRLDSYFQRAFGHAVAAGTRVEGQRVVQRLMTDLARLVGGAHRSNVTPSR